MLQMIVIQTTRSFTGVRDGGSGGQLPPQFGQFVDINSGRESRIFGQNTIHLINTNLGSVIAVDGNNFCYYSLEITENYCYYPPPPHRMWSASGDHGKFLLLPPPTESGRLQTICVRHSGKTRFDPPNGCWPVRLWAVTLHQAGCQCDHHASCSTSSSTS